MMIESTEQNSFVDFGLQQNYLQKDIFKHAIATILYKTNFAFSINVVFDMKPLY